MTGLQLEWHDMRRTINRIYETEAGRAGCCLHICVDDGNTTDSSVAIVLEAAEKSGHIMCRLVARFLDGLTVQERRAFLSPMHQWIPDPPGPFPQWRCGNCGANLQARNGRFVGPIEGPCPPA